MKKVMNLVFGGIQHKVFNLVIGTTVCVIFVFLAVISFQSRRLTELVDESGREQQDSIREITTETMETVVDNTLARSVQLEAYIIDKIFKDIKMDVSLLRQHTVEVFSDPDTYEQKSVNPPMKGWKNQVCVQLLGKEGTDFQDKDIMKEAGLLGNMADMMEAIVMNEEHLEACYIGTPGEILVIADSYADKKLKEDGTPVSINPVERYWYQGAVAENKLFFTKVETDIFTGSTIITCACPVYVNHRLVAVIGADLFLDELKRAVEESVSEAGFEIIVDEEGHVIFSPMKEGVFRLLPTNQAEDLRESEEEELASFVQDALKGQTNVRQVKVEGKNYYMAGAAMPTVGWSILSIVDKEKMDVPAKMMLDSYDAISERAIAVYENNIAQGKRMIIILMILVSLLTMGGALTLGKKIVKPLNTMTLELGRLSEKHKVFQMRDAYRTGDEIQVLAESFADLSMKTVKYMEKIRLVTAEKERIGTELSMANDIQTSQLPQIFPPYPEKKEFDLYASMSPAKEVGGDFYDFFLIDHDHMALVMADVSGKGVPAALFMMIAKILIKTQIQSGESPASALANVNGQIMEGNDAEMFVTVWLCILNLSTGKGIAANAGHEHPVLKRAGGKYELVVYRHSPALGTMDGICFREHEFQLYPGDVLFVYTDGVAEATDAENNLFGTDRMLEALNQDTEAKPRQVLLNVKQGIERFVGNAEQFDDITMLCLEYVGPKE